RTMVPSSSKPTTTLCIKPLRIPIPPAQFSTYDTSATDRTLICMQATDRSVDPPTIRSHTSWLDHVVLAGGPKPPVLTEGDAKEPRGAALLQAEALATSAHHRRICRKDRHDSTLAR